MGLELLNMIPQVPMEKKRHTELYFKIKLLHYKGTGKIIQM